VPVTRCPAPSPDTVVAAGHEAMPERLSAQVHVTVTGPVAQPAPAGERWDVRVGGVLSTSTVTSVSALTLPLRSVAVALTVVLPSSATVTVAPAPSTLSSTGSSPSRVMVHASSATPLPVSPSAR
jgi:hypothetical protein